MRTKHEALEQFLGDVDEQIAYQPMHSTINEELRGHIEDKAETYMDFGLAEEEAFHRAVRDMGDPSALGASLNEKHHLRIAKPLLGLILTLTLLGVMGNVVDGSLYQLFDSLYFVWGIAVLLVIMWRGYPMLLKYTDVILKILVLCCLGMSVLPLMTRLFNGEWFTHHFLSIYSVSVRYGVLQLSIPLMAVLLYRNRRNGIKSICIVFAYEALMIFLAMATYVIDYAYVPIVTLLVSCTGIIIYMIVKEYLAVSEIKGTLVTILGTAAVFLLFIFMDGSNFIDNMQMFVNPGAKASVQTAWDDSYNNVLIQDLLGKAELFGEVQLSEEELIRYNTSQWYYEDGEGSWNNGEEGWISLEKHTAYKMQFADSLELEDILPQHYLNNYRIAYWILKYGLIPALLPVLLILATQIFMLITAWKIRNPLGRLTALSGAFAFFVQNLFYFLGNFGFQFGQFGNLPFVSEGLVSITGTMIMAGLILSAYRFDTVIKETS